jgi:glycosyltransferase involved in cell wall biosynthesis
VKVIEEAPVTLVTVVHNEAARLPGFLLYHAPMVNEIYVVDQGSTDATPYILEELCLGNVTYVVEECRGTPEVSRPDAIKRASNEWVLILDGDELLDPGVSLNYITQICDFCDLNRYTRVGGKNETRTDGQPQDEYLPNRRLFKRSYADIPRYDNIGSYAHSQIQPTPDARVHLWPGVGIWHFKTIAEQHESTCISADLMRMQGRKEADKYGP